MIFPCICCLKGLFTTAKAGLSLGKAWSVMRLVTFKTSFFMSSGVWENSRAVTFHLSPLGNGFSRALILGKSVRRYVCVCGGGGVGGGVVDITRSYYLLKIYKVRSTLVISKPRGLSKTLRDIRTSTCQIFGIKENN